MLNVHRGNYKDGVPDLQRLQLIWWEFPQEHWDEIRDGSSMNYLQVPASIEVPNSPMDDDATKIAADFIDELLEIGAMGPLPEGVQPHVVAPLFAVAKAGQPGQFRIIADFRRGTQNLYAGADPVYLNRPTHILEKLYRGGWSAVVDASKYFYQFKTRPEDWPFIFLRHPITGIVYTYYGLPMGSSNSPALGGRFGLGFVRAVLKRVNGPTRDGTVENNTWWSPFSATGEYHPSLGHGYLLRRADGSLPIHIWVHVDDFFIHTATESACHEALSLFLDVAVKHGLLCHPGKLQPPTQVQKYVGFLFDTRDVPRLLIPPLKCDRAIAMVRFVLSRPLSHRFSHLALSVVSGTLESLTDATPYRMGHTHLRSMYDLIHKGDMFGLETYLRCSPMDSSIRSDLEWWEATLLADEGSFAYGKQAHVLVPTWGDGSGTGTGGTIQLPVNEIVMRMWMGVWSPHVFRYTSNWRELDTLRLTLQQLVDGVSSGKIKPIPGTTLFYFTDNEVTYFICSAGSSTQPNLHALIVEIRRLQFILGVFLNVVHVPGLVMIQQGTDNLSRGVWVSPLHSRTDSQTLNGLVFAPLDFDSSLVRHVLRHWSLPISQWVHQPWDKPWEVTSLFDTCTVWFPPPEMARQALIFQLLAFCERPLTTLALFFIPRIMVGCWRSLSSYLTELVVLKEGDWEFSPPRALPQIPVWVIYLAPHVRKLSPVPSSRMDSVPPSADEFWHRKQAEHMRGL